MGIERTRMVIAGLIKVRGERAKQIWTLMSGFNPMVSPEQALITLQHSINVLRPDLQQEAKNLARDIGNIIGALKP